MVGVHYPALSSTPTPIRMWGGPQFFPRFFVSIFFAQNGVWVPWLQICWIQQESKINLCEFFNVTSCHVAQLWPLSTNGAGGDRPESPRVWGPPHTWRPEWAYVADHTGDNNLGTLILNMLQICFPFQNIWFNAVLYI